MRILLIYGDISKAIRSVLANEIHDVLSPVCHVLREDEAKMAEWVCLLPDELVGWQVIHEPFELFDCSKLVVGADEETGRDRELVDWDLWWGYLAVLVHVFFVGAEVVP